MFPLHRRSVVVGTGASIALLAAGVMLVRPAPMKAQGLGGVRLSQAELRTITAQAVEAASQIRSAQGLRSDATSTPPLVRATRMHIAVVARDGSLLAHVGMPDAWVGSQDIAIAKARTAAFFSSNENALTSRIVGVLAQAHDPNGDGGAGPLWGIGDSNQVGITGGPQTRNGIITFPGGLALYKNGVLVGGIGVSGDAVDQDEAVAFAGAAGFLPGPGVVALGYTPPVVPGL